MKKQSRLTALLLALCMLMSTLPVSALADGIQTLEDYLSAVQRVQQELSESSIPVEEENAYTLTRTTTTETIVRETVTGELSGEGESAFTLPVAGKLELSTAAAADAYQWQIDVGGVWANIVGDTAAAVTLTYAKVQNALSGGTARVRCAMTQDGQTVYSAVAAVTVDETVKTQTVEGTEEISAVSYTSEAPRSLARTLNAGVGTYNAVPLDDTPPTYNVVINYLFENNEIVADPYTASLAAGTSFSATVTFPTVQGYLPYLNNNQQNSLELNYTAINQDHTYNVVYKPTNVNYTVIHYQQNLNDDNHTEAERETKQGLTNSTVPEVKKEYEGFYALLYEKPAIAADGSTVVEVNYDRYYYLMNFDLDGGYGVEPIYARYGTPITGVGTPTKAGYTFSGWSQNGTTVVSLPETMPAENRTYKAVWEADNTAKVTIVFWGENADDEGYSYIKSTQVNVKPGTEFTYSENGSLICALEVHTHSIEKDCYKLTCTQEEHTHSESCYPYTCGETEHTNHTTACYDGVGNKQNVYTDVPDNPSNGLVIDHWYYGKLIYINRSWYRYSGSTEAGKIAPTTCHKHTEKCLGCGKTVHTHSIENGCYTLTCTKTEHSHTSDCYMNGAGLDKSLWTFVKSDTVTVAADGSTVVNVYYDRTEKTLTFKYKYNGWDYQSTETITAKWGANISEKYKKIAANAGSTFWSAKTNGDGPYTNYFGVMPQTSATYYNRGDTGDTGTMTYWGQDLDGNYTVKLFEVTGVGGYTVTVEDRYEFEGFTYDHGTSIGSSCRGAEFYYTRNSYTLTFNDGYKDVKSETVLYQAQLSKYSSYKPEAPSAYEPGSVTFGGWYLNPECTGEEYKLAEHKMPADNVLLYAKWVPVNRKVEFYLDEAALKDGTELSTHPYITVPHGSKADPTPANPTNGSYTFVGWFYMEDGEEKAFDFANMPVTKDLQVYGKWSSNVLKKYTIYYKIQDTDTQIADPTTGSGLAGITKTFDAKGGTELYADYQEGYFPVTKSHSMTIDIDANKENDTNVYTFWYVQKPAVPYTVRYLIRYEDGTTSPAFTNDDGTEYVYTNAENHKAVVTETFKVKQGYLPDAYQKRLVVSVDENGNPDTEHNVIIFYYTKDDKHAYYKITHYTENLADAQGNTTWTEYNSSQIVGTINEEYEATSIDIPGFTYDSTVPGTVTSGKLTANGLELKLYYKRNSYPYQVRYLEKDTGKQLADPKNGTGKYGQVVSEDAKDIANYDAVVPTSKTLDIRIEESQTEANLNVITFYYKEKEATINYVVVGPDGCGTVTPTSEKLKVLTGTAQGSMAAAAENYRFVGWYTDAECTAQNLVSTDEKYVPTQPSHTDNGETVKDPWVAATYYAKFEYNLTTLKVTKSGMQSIDAGQSFLFKVSGPNLPKDGLLIAIHGNDSETISGLVVGKEYWVTEEKSWSWRYSAEPQSITLQPTGNEVTISNTRDKTQWLDGDCYAENVFNKQGN